jgi:hypothetical protein
MTWLSPRGRAYCLSILSQLVHGPDCLAAADSLRMLMRIELFAPALNLNAESR